VYADIAQAASMEDENEDAWAAGPIEYDDLYATVRRGKYCVHCNSDEIMYVTS